MLHELIQPLIEQYGVYAVFTIVMLESTGVPVPGETALVFASIYAGSTGRLNPAEVIAAASAGAIIGDNFGYMIGRKFGLPLVIRYGSKIGFHEKRLTFAQYMFSKHGAKIVFFGRFVAVLRIFAAMLAGVNKFSWRSFMIYNAAGGIIWAMIFGLGGYWCGDLIQRVSGPFSIIAFALGLIGFIGGWWAVRRHEADYEQRMLALIDGQKEASSLNSRPMDALESQ